MMIKMNMMIYYKKWNKNRNMKKMNIIIIKMKYELFLVMKY